MSSHCADEHSPNGHNHQHDHDHDHDHGDAGPADNLYAKIDHPNIVALNGASLVVKICKPWNERMNEDVYLESDSDDQLIIRVPFTGSVKLRSILLKTGPGDQTPTKIDVYSNEDSLDFSDVQDKKPIQEFPVVQSRDVGEYTVKPAKFPNVSSITLFIPSGQGADTVRIYYLGFLGSWTERKTDPVIAVYEANANIADHEKIQGTEGNFNPTQF